MKPCVIVTLVFVLSACAPGRFRPPVTAGTFIHDPETHRVDGGIPGTTTNRAFTGLAVDITPAAPIREHDANLFRVLLGEYLRRNLDDDRPRVLKVAIGDSIDYSIADVSGKVLESSSVRDAVDLDAAARFIAERVAASRQR